MYQVGMCGGVLEISFWRFVETKKPPIIATEVDSFEYLQGCSVSCFFFFYLTKLSLCMGGCLSIKRDMNEKNTSLSYGL